MRLANSSGIAVPMAMALPIKITSAVRFNPENTSPAMISRMALVRERPGTRSISVPMEMDSRFVLGNRFTHTRAMAEITAAHTKVRKNTLEPVMCCPNNRQSPAASPHRAAERKSQGPPWKNRAKKAAALVYPNRSIPEGKTGD